jgi:hypothetical protein
MVDISQPSVDKGLTQIEGLLNFAGYFPPISPVSGAARMVYAQFLTIGSIACAALKLVASWFTPDAAKKAKLVAESKMFVDYALHGVSNAVRASIEMMPWINLLTLVYDYVASMRHNYKYEPRQNNLNYLVNYSAGGVVRI